MLVKQISIFLENKSGRLAEVVKTLGDQNINISALTIADTTNFGILRLVVSKPEEAEKILKGNGFTVRTTNVIAVEVSDRPGGLIAALKILEEAEVDIEYMYAFVGKTQDKAHVIFKIGDYKRAITLLTNGKIRVLTSQEVYQL